MVRDLYRDERLRIDGDLVQATRPEKVALHVCCNLHVHVAVRKVVAPRRKFVVDSQLPVDVQERPASKQASKRAREKGGEKRFGLSKILYS